ncbi:MAG: hypothetical protein AB7P04_13520 [Bacteriovoracia bacterium]
MKKSLLLNVVMACLALSAGMGVRATSAEAGREGIATEAAIYWEDSEQSAIRIELGWGGAKSFKEGLQLGEMANLVWTDLETQYGPRPYAMMILDRQGAPTLLKRDDVRMRGDLTDPKREIRFQGVVCSPNAADPDFFLQLKGDVATFLYEHLAKHGVEYPGNWGHPSYRGTHVQCFKKRVARRSRGGGISVYRPLVTLCDIRIDLAGMILPVKEETKETE